MEIQFRLFQKTLTVRHAGDMTNPNGSSLLQGITLLTASSIIITIIYLEYLLYKVNRSKDNQNLSSFLALRAIVVAVFLSLAEALHLGLCRAGKKYPHSGPCPSSV